MISLKNPDLQAPRQKAIAAMRASLSPEQWERNAQFVAQLRQEIAQHPVSRHPAIARLNSGTVRREAMEQIHLEYRHAIVQSFTDALLAAQMQSRQLEPRLAPGSKMAGRFLLTLNVLDEFGFRPGQDAQGYYLGNPAYAHYPLYEDVLNAYGISNEARVNHRPSAIAREVRAFLEDSYGRYTDVATLLAVAEEEVILFSPPLRKATGALGLEVNDGYYYVHGVSDDDSAEAADDDHEDDLWFILTQALTDADRESLRTLGLRYCDLWVRFWDHQMTLADGATAMGQAGRGDRLGVVAMQAREAALGGAPPDAVGSAGAKGLSRPSGAAGVSVAGVATAVAASGNPTRPAERGAPTAIPPAAAVADQLMVLKDFLEAQRFFFIASASAAGDCDCSYRGRKAPPQDEPEPLLIVCAGGEVVFPDYPGNHLMNTLGNLLQQPEVALLFVDFSREARSVLLQGQAEVQGMDGVDAALRARWPTAPRVVRLRVSRLREQRVDGLPVLQFARM